MDGPSLRSRRDEKDPNYERRTLPRHDEMPDLASWDTQAAGVVHRGNHYASEMDREGEQDEDYEDMASDLRTKAAPITR
jgi:hypothetical protein